MIYTKEEFNKLWNANDTGSGITFDDVADCAKDWGLYSTPRIHRIDIVRNAVLEAAGCETYPLDEEYDEINDQELASFETNEHLEQS